MPQKLAKFRRQKWRGLNFAVLDFKRVAEGSGQYDEATGSFRHGDSTT